jgi:AraC-like DNA-binding protein
MRIHNMEDDLSFLESREVSVKMPVLSPALTPFIESIVYCNGQNLGREYETAIPDGTAQLQIVVGNGGRELSHPLTRRVQQLRNAWIMGINSIPITYKLSDLNATIYVRFKPGGLFAFTKVHQQALNNVVVDANKLFGHAVDDLQTLISQDATPEAALDRVAKFFLKLLNDVCPRPVLVDFMLENTDAPLVELARRTGYSSKYLTKTFQKYVGIGPKSLQRILRFSQALKYLNQLTGNVDWTHIVCEYGYHDQAHFIKDFKEFTGFSPLNYLALGGTCVRYFHSSVHPDKLVAEEQ